VSRIIVVTGTDTGVGKTVLTALLALHLRTNGTNVAALKPICSGGRDDARSLLRAAGGTLRLDEINPWHFRSALAPLLAARQENRQVTLREVVAHVHQFVVHSQVVLVEGAGGLLSPLGEGFSTRELINALGAELIVVARNQLGVINHVRLTSECLPPIIRSRVKIALMDPRNPDKACRTNAALLREFLGNTHVVPVPWLNVRDLERASQLARVKDALSALLA
jgi:dethiobiotin synthetase